MAETIFGLPGAVFWLWFSLEENKGTTISFTIPLRAKVEIEEMFRKI